MEITNKTFWREALKGGTIIGLVMSGFNLIQYMAFMADMPIMARILGFLSIVVLVCLIYAFTKKISSSASPAQGFTYGRCIGFVAAMMIFTGIIDGVYSAIFNNFVNPAGILESLEATIARYQYMFDDIMFDETYRMMKSMTFNPIWLVITRIIGNVFVGVVISLFTSALAKRNPDVFTE